MRQLMTATLLSFAAVGADAQSTTSRIAVTGGVATDQRGVRSHALSAAPSVSFDPSSSVSIQLGGSATRFGTNLFALGAGGALTSIGPLGRFAALALSATGGVTRLQGSSSAQFAQADLTPALELRLQPLTLFAGARAATGHTRDSGRSGRLPIAGTPGEALATTRHGAGPVFGGMLTLSAASATLRLGARDERLLIAGVAAPERSLSALLSFALGATASLELSAGRFDANRILATPAGDYASVGLAFRFGGAREAMLPEAGETRPALPGATRLAIHAPRAAQVEIAGDFNEWTPAAATRAANGVWYVDLRIPPGQYRYAFRIDGVEWRVPSGATAVDDGFGGKSAWVTVPDTRSRS